MAHVFISYSKARGAEAEKLTRELGNLGYSVWWDTSLLPIGKYTAAIDRELDAAKAVLVIWSPESVESDWVRSEAEHGRQQRKLVNTHTSDLSDPGVQIPKPFNQTHSVVIDNVRAIVAALDALSVPRSGGTRTPTPLVAPADNVADADDRLFAEVGKVNSAEAYTYYLKEVPNGRNAAIAKFRLQALRPPSTVVSATATATPPPPSSLLGGRDQGDKRTEQAADERIVPQPHGRARPALLAGGIVVVGVVLALVLLRPFESAPPPPTPPSGGSPGVPPPTPQPHLAEVSIPVPLSLDRERVLNPTDTFKECDACPEMVVVPAGSFTMGSPASETGRSYDEGPQHTVEFARVFAVGRFAVTFAEWDACVRDGGCNGYQPADQGWGRDRRPVINVSWHDAKAYVAWLGQRTRKAYRLLSEAEREYVTRAGTTTPFWWGDSIATSQANYDGTYTYGGGTTGEHPQRTLPVHSFKPNPWGLFQVHGNVWEWVEDCWNDSYAGAPADGSAWMAGDCSRRVVRGGSWLGNPEGLRSADRVGNPTVDRNRNLGFRIGRTLTP